MTAIGALTLEIILSIINPEFFKFDFSTLSVAFIVFVFIEEILKLLVIWKISQNINSKTKIILNSILLGFGFGTTEIILHTLSQPTFTFLPYLNLVIIHITTCIIFSYFFFKKYTFEKIILAFLLANLIHFLYNFGILYNFKALFSSIILIVFNFLLFFIIFLPSKEN